MFAQYISYPMAATLLTNIPVFPVPIFAGNLPDLRFSGINTITGMPFILAHTFAGSTTVNVLNETIFPDADGNATIKIRSVVESLLLHNYPSSPFFNQVNAITTLTLTYDTTTIFIRVIKGGLLIPESSFESYDYQAFLLDNLLSWMPSERKVKYRETNFLNYYVTPGQTGAQPYMKVYYFDESGMPLYQEQAMYGPIPVGNLYSMDVSFNQLITRVYPAKSNIFAFEVSIKRNGNTISNTQRLVLDNQFDEFDDVFAFSNSIGGFETIRFNGKFTELENHESQVFLNTNSHAIEFETIPLREITKNTGYFEADDYRKWVREFFTSSLRYFMRFGELVFIPERIAISSVRAESVKSQPNAFEFTFKIANQVPWQLNTREILNPINVGMADRAPVVGDLSFDNFNEDFSNQSGTFSFTDEVFGV
jgi:hypothetical protein